MSAQPLSKCLSDLLEDSGGGAALTVNEVIVRTGGRGAYLLIMLLSLPFISPIPLIGVSSILGPVIALLAWRLAWGRPAWVPRSMGERLLPAGLREFLRGGGVRALRWIEQGVRPRASGWMRWRAARLVHCGIIALMGLLLALPLPIPFTNSLPAITILVLSASMMEEDGLAVVAGHALAVATAAYFLFSAGAISVALMRLMEAVRSASA